MRIAVVGSTGFVGRHLTRHFLERGIEVRPIGRAEALVAEQAAAGCDALINCAGEKSGVGPAAEEANVDLPERLFLAAAAAGIPAMVHVSSVAALTSSTARTETVTDNYQGYPTAPYGISKRRGDDRLSELVHRHPETHLVILRPPILIGPDADGPFAMLSGAARREIPLPIRGANNRRSLMHVENFAAAIASAAEAQMAGTYVVTDSPPISTEELYIRVAQTLGRKPRLIPIGGIGRKILRRLLGSRGDSLFGDAAFSGHRFVEDCPIEWPIPAGSIIERAILT